MNPTGNSVIIRCMPGAKWDTKSKRCVRRTKELIPYVVRIVRDGKGVKKNNKGAVMGKTVNCNFGRCNTYRLRNFQSKPVSKLKSEVTCKDLERIHKHPAYHVCKDGRQLMLHWNPKLVSSTLEPLRQQVQRNSNMNIPVPGDSPLRVPEWQGGKKPPKPKAPPRRMALWKKIALAVLGVAVAYGIYRLIRWLIDRGSNGGDGYNDGGSHISIFKNKKKVGLKVKGLQAEVFRALAISTAPANANRIHALATKNEKYKKVKIAKIEKILGRFEKKGWVAVEGRGYALKLRPVTPDGKTEFSGVTFNEADKAVEVVYKGRGMPDRYTGWKADIIFAMRGETVTFDKINDLIPRDVSDADMNAFLNHTERSGLVKVSNDDYSLAVDELVPTPKTDKPKQTDEPDKPAKPNQPAKTSGVKLPAPKTGAGLPHPADILYDGVTESAWRQAVSNVVEGDVSFAEGILGTHGVELSDFLGMHPTKADGTPLTALDVYNIMVTDGKGDIDRFGVSPSEAMVYAQMWAIKETGGKIEDADIGEVSNYFIDIAELTGGQKYAGGGGNLYKGFMSRIDFSLSNAAARDKSGAYHSIFGDTHNAFAMMAHMSAYLDAEGVNPKVRDRISDTLHDVVSNEIDYGEAAEKLEGLGTIDLGYEDQNHFFKSLKATVIAQMQLSEAIQTEDVNESFLLLERAQAEHENATKYMETAIGVTASYKQFVERLGKSIERKMVGGGGDPDGNGEPGGNSGAGRSDGAGDSKPTGRGSSRRDFAPMGSGSTVSFDSVQLGKEVRKALFGKSSFNDSVPPRETGSWLFVKPQAVDRGDETAPPASPNPLNPALHSGGAVMMPGYTVLAGGGAVIN